MVMAFVHVRNYNSWKGLVELDRLVEQWENAPSTYSPTNMRACLDSFRDVLFRHLDEEVG